MNPFELAEKLLDCTIMSGLTGFSSRKYLSQPGRYLTDLLRCCPEFQESIHKLRAEHLDHPWFAKLVAGVEDWLTIARRGADKEQQRIINTVSRGK